MAANQQLTTRKRSNRFCIPHHTVKANQAQPASQSAANNAVPERFSTFTLFPELAPELRLIIWRHALPSPVNVFVDHPNITKEFHHYHSPKYFAMLRVNKEARELALEFYKPSFDQILKNPVYFDFRLDTLEFRDVDDFQQFLRRCVHVARIKSVADDDNPDGRRSNLLDWRKATPDDIQAYQLQSLRRIKVGVFTLPSRPFNLVRWLFHMPALETITFVEWALMPEEVGVYHDNFAPGVKEFGRIVGRALKSLAVSQPDRKVEVNFVKGGELICQDTVTQFGLNGFYYETDYYI